MLKRRNVGHFGHTHFGLGRFGPNISATDVSATENAKGGPFGQNHKLWVGVDSMHVKFFSLVGHQHPSTRIWKLIECLKVETARVVF